MRGNPFDTGQQKRKGLIAYQDSLREKRIEYVIKNLPQLRQISATAQELLELRAFSFDYGIVKNVSKKGKFPSDNED